MAYCVTIQKNLPRQNNWRGFFVSFVSGMVRMKEEQGKLSVKKALFVLLKGFFDILRASKL